MLNAGRAIVWDSALGVGRHKMSDYVIAARLGKKVISVRLVSFATSIKLAY